MMPQVSEIVVLLHIETGSTFMVVQIIEIKSLSLVVMSQKYMPDSSLILSVEHVGVTTIIYFSAFQLKTADCVINQKVLCLTNGGSGSHT